ncbi:hypothetical protein GCM10027053_30470 [Intrasporangium mesophilum]
MVAVHDRVQQLKGPSCAVAGRSPALHAATLLAALQGGPLLCQTCTDVSALELYRIGAIEHLRRVADWRRVYHRSSEVSGGKA